MHLPILGINRNSLQGNILVVPAKPMVILPQPSEICFQDLHYFWLAELPSIIASFEVLVFEAVVVVPMENQIKILLVGAVAILRQVMVLLELWDRLAPCACVLGQIVGDAHCLLFIIGGHFMQREQLIGLAIDEVWLCFNPVCLLQRLWEFILCSAS